MKKTLLAAALALGFTGVAQAETSVTLYGILDGGIGYQQIKGDGFKTRKTGLINGVQSGNRWGLRGTEDLGNGLQAVFQVESGFDLATGNQAQGNANNDRLFGRHATLGLRSDAWGQLDIGRQTNIGSKYFGAIDPFGQGFGQANIGATFGAVNTVRWDNMVMYQTPNFSGFQFGVGYSFNTNGAQRSSLDIDGVADLNESDRNRRGITTGLRYNNGPLAAALSYEQEKVGGASGGGLVAGSDVTVRAYQLGLAYDFEVVKVHAAFGQTRNGMFGAGISSLDSNAPVSVGSALDGLKYNHYLLGLSAPLGAGKILASWQMADPRSNPDAAPNAELDKMNIYSLGYTYDLSKRTNMYVFGSYAKDVNFQDGVKSTYAGVGLRHRF